MQSINFTSKYENSTIPIQIIKLQDSYFIYVGNTGMTFDNINVSFYNKEVKINFKTLE